MGWTVLYIAFGAVALWLLSEVLLQYKARLRWRLLAFGGFLGVVVGVLLSSVVVIGLGAIAFAIGQTYVTLSFRKGFAKGWALGARSGAEDAADGAGAAGGGPSRRRRAGRGGRADGPAAVEGPREPALEVSQLEEEIPAAMAGFDPDPGQEPIYQPQPMPDDTNGYGIYSGDFDAPAAGQGGHPHQGGEFADFPPYDPYGNGQQPGVPQPDPAFGVPGQTQQFPAYTDSYGTGQQPYQTPFDGADGFGGTHHPYPADPYYAQQSYDTDTPPGGIWVPQQRDTDLPQQHQDQPSPFDHDPG
ncbi:hypothetical protein, partial [Streptomyces clavuligerus]